LIDRHPKIIATPALMKIAEIALEKTAGEGSLTQQP
jgi:hypothetical protein